MWYIKTGFCKMLVNREHNVVFDISNMGEAALKSHMKGSKHVELMQTVAKTVSPITNFITVEAANKSSPIEKANGSDNDATTSGSTLHQ